MIYLYAITEQTEANLPDLCGLEEAPVFGLPYRDLAAVVSCVSAAEVPPLEANLWLHETVVERVMADRTVLPVRFGTIFDSERAAQAALAAPYADFVADLKRVRGRVELGVRVLREDEGEPSPSPSADRLAGNQSGAPQPASGSGRAYLLAWLEEDRRVRAWRAQAEALATELHTPLARLAAQSTFRVLTTPRLLLTAAYLVDREGVAAFRRELGALTAAHPELRLLCTGPWPPYSFVTAGVPLGGQQEEECSHLTRSS